MLVIGQMENVMVKEYINEWMDHVMKDSGKMIDRMDLVKKLGQMAHLLLELIKKD